MAQLKPETLRQKIDEARAELVLMDEIERSVQALKFTDSLFAYRMWTTCKTERPKTSARIERWQRMLAERESVPEVLGAAERDSRTTLPDDETRTRVRCDV